jgi:hypothetical protein
MNGDPNTDRDLLNPLDIPSAGLNGEIKAAIQKLWDIGFKHHVGDHDLVLTITRNARLQTLLSRQADEQTQRIVRLTKWLLWLTAALLLATFVLAYIAWETDERLRHIHEISKELKSSNPPHP